MNNERELRFFLEYVPDPVVQAYLPGREFTLDVLCDFGGRAISVVPRERLVIRSGVSDRGRTWNNPALIDMGAQVATALGVRGPANIQVKLQGDAITIFEVNPRFSGGIPLTLAAGADFPGWLIELRCGRKLKPCLGRFKDGLVMGFMESPLFHADLLTGHEPAPRSGTLASAANVRGERQFAATGWWFMGGLDAQRLGAPWGREPERPTAKVQRRTFNCRGCRSLDVPRSLQLALALRLTASAIPRQSTGMQVLTSTLGDAQVLALTGRLDSDTAPEFEETYLRVPAGEARTLVLDLTALEYLSSAGLRAILSAGKALQAQEGKLVLFTTTISGAVSAVNAIEKLRKQQVHIRSIQEYNKDSQSAFNPYLQKYFE